MSVLLSQVGFAKSTQLIPLDPIMPKHCPSLFKQTFCSGNYLSSLAMCAARLPGGMNPHTCSVFPDSCIKEVEVDLPCGSKVLSNSDIADLKAKLEALDKLSPAVDGLTAVQVKELLEFAKTRIAAAEKALNDGLFEDAHALKSIALVVLDVLTGVTPGIDLARDLYELLTGKDLITGEELDEFGRMMAAVGILTAGKGNDAYRVSRAMDKGADAVRALDSGKAIVNSARYELKSVDSWKARVHILDGEYKLENGSKLLKGGLHTAEKTEEFITSLPPDVQKQIVQEVLPNGVVRTTFPEKGALTDRHFIATEDASKGGRGVPGGKTSFPKSWDSGKIDAGIESVLKNGILVTENLGRGTKVLRGKFDSVEIELNIGPKSGGGTQINSAFPSWEQ
jgi:hypothetical protein